MTSNRSVTLTFRQLVGNPEALGRLLATEGAVRTGHYRLLSGQHTDQFLAFSAIAADPAALDLIASWLAPTVEAWAPDSVIAPSTAGVGLAATLARTLSAPLHLIAAGPDGRPAHVLGSAITPRSRILLVNDITTTGAALTTLSRIATSAGAEVVGAAIFAARDTRSLSTFTLPIARVADLDLPAWPGNTCPLCDGNKADLEDARDLN